MTSRNKKIKELPPKTVPQDAVIDNLSAFAYLEFILQNSEETLRPSICKVFIETDYNLTATCQISNISLDVVLSTVFEETDFVKFSKILSYIPKNERLDYLLIFTNCWDLQVAFDRISTIMVFNGEAAPRNDQWPYKIPLENDHNSFIELLKETNDDPQVYVLFRMNNYDVHAVRNILGVPSSRRSVGVTPMDENFRKLCLELSPEEREVALEIYESNGQDINLTCQLLGIRRSRKGRKSRVQRVNVDRQFIRPKSPLIWPDHDKQEPAEVCLQMEAHPTIIDIHYYICSEATEAVTTFLKFHQREQTLSELQIITGKGNNSETKAILREHVKQLLKNMKIPYCVDSNNSGKILLSIIPQ